MQSKISEVPFTQPKTVKTWIYQTHKLPLFLLSLLTRFGTSSSGRTLKYTVRAEIWTVLFCQVQDVFQNGNNWGAVSFKSNKHAQMIYNFLGPFNFQEFRLGRTTSSKNFTVGNLSREMKVAKMVSQALELPAFIEQSSLSQRLMFTDIFGMKVWNFNQFNRLSTISMSPKLWTTKGLFTMADPTAIAQNKFDTGFHYHVYPTVLFQEMRYVFSHYSA